MQVYGSAAYALSFPSSAVDVAVEHCHELPETFARFVDVAHQVGYTVIASTSGEAQCSVRLRDDASGLTANIILIVGSAPVRQSVDVVRHYLRRFPAAGPVVLAARALLAQRGLANVHDGGLSSYAVTVMVFHHFLSQYPAEEAQCKGEGEALFDFLAHYGSGFDFARDAVVIPACDDACGRPPVLRRSGGGGIVVCDPLDVQNNMAAGCSRGTEVQAALKDYHTALAAWRSAAAAAAGDEVEAGFAASARGKTPLSPVIFFKARSEIGVVSSA